MSPLLCGSGGELISVQVSVDPKALEDLLECLSSVSFPINPQIYHGVPTRVEFPAWESCLDEVRRALQASGFDANSIQVSGMLASIGS